MIAVHIGRPRLKRPKEEAEAVMAETASASSRASSPAGSIKRTASPSPEVRIMVFLNILRIKEILNVYSTVPDTHQIAFGSEYAINNSDK
jgi:hypothetical protein